MGIEDILGKVERRETPFGFESQEEDFAFFLQYFQNEDPQKIFDYLLGGLRPPFPSSGAAILSGWSIRRPDEIEFLSIKLRGDVNAWILKLEAAAKCAGRLTATIHDGRIISSDSMDHSLVEVESFRF